MKKIFLVTAAFVFHSGVSFAENPSVGMPESMKQAEHGSHNKVDYTAPAALEKSEAVYSDGSKNRFGDASPAVAN